MIKILMLSGAALLFSLGTAFAATQSQDGFDTSTQAYANRRVSLPINGAARSRIDEGTGYYSVGTATGGPVAAFPDRL